MREVEQQMGAPVSASVTAKGGRSENQDRAGEGPAGSGRAFVVADGLGGHAAGEVAAETAVTALLGALRELPEPTPERLRDAFDVAQRAVQQVQVSEPASAGCRTTAAVLVLDGGHALWGHVGDTRLYHLRGGRVADQTLDHSVPQALVQAGAISSSAIRGHPDRNRLLRSLGGEGDAEPTISGAAIPLQDGDAFLLCTDGFWEHVTEPEMEAALAEAGAPSDWLRRLETRVLARARGAFDNYTATAVFLGTRRPPGRRPRLALAVFVVALLIAVGAWAGVLRCGGTGPGALVFGARAAPAPLLPAGGGAPGAQSGPRLH
jgi:serine/threonine protein phosphatase PrpC